MIATRDTALDSAIGRARSRLLPFLVLMYVLAFIDRANVGFAKSVLQADTDLSDVAFAFGAGVFFIGYAIFEVPSNLLMYRFGARVWMSRIMVTWGIVSACTALVHDATSFYALRVPRDSGSGFLPRHHPVSFKLVSGQDPLANHGRVLLRLSACAAARQSGVRALARRVKSVRPASVAMAVRGRRRGGFGGGCHRLLLPDRSSRRCTLAQRRATRCIELRVAHRGRTQARTWTVLSARRLAR